MLVWGDRLAGQDGDAPQCDLVGHDGCGRRSLHRGNIANCMPVALAQEFLYRRLAAALRSQIEQGVLRVGDRLPSVRALQRLYKVSAATAMEALDRTSRRSLAHSISVFRATVRFRRAAAKPSSV